MVDDATMLERAMAYIRALEAQRDAARMLGHRDGVVTAMLAVRRRMGPVRERLRLAPAHHVKVRASAQQTLDMLQSLDDELDRRRKETVEATRERQAVEIVSPGRPETLTKI